MAQFDGLTIWTAAWVSDTNHLSRAQRGAYMDLLILMWRSPGCQVPNDNGWLQQHLLATKDELRDVFRPVIDEFCQVTGNWITQKRLQKEFYRLVEKQKRGSDAAKTRWRNRKKSTNSNAEKTGDA